MLEWDTPLSKVLDDFPMLEDMDTDELEMLLGDCEDAEEDAPLIRAIQIILKGNNDDLSGEPRSRQPAL